MLSTMGLCRTHAPQIAPLADRVDQAEIAWLDLNPCSQQGASGWRTYDTIASLLEEATADVLVLDGPADQVCEALWCLRNNNDYAESLILLQKEAGPMAAALADGLLPREAQTLQQRWLQWQQRRRQWPEGDQEWNPMHQLDRWLWPRPNGWIQPISDPCSPSLYRYPLLEILSQQPTEERESWLEHQCDQGYYERGALVDRIRLCRSCGSGHLNYVDICGQCHSLEIARQPCLHCFNCGHVGAQEHFRKDAALLCPNCLTQLRHIGSDYDRPLENYRCRECDNLFIDAHVEARCLSCGGRHTPENLQIKEIRPFRLSNKGRIALLKQRIRPSEEATAIDQNSAMLSEDQFNNILNWQLSILRKKNPNTLPERAPALMAIWKMDAQQISEPNTQSSHHDWISVLLEKLDETVRITCSNQQLAWVLHPECERSQLLSLIHTYQSHLSANQANATRSAVIKGRLLTDQQISHDDAITLKNRILASLVNPGSDEH